MRLNNSIENWQNYLSFSSNMYSYGFADILKVYSAEPTATAVATLEEWNRMGRFINPKAKGFIFSDGHIRYDIKDTNGASVRKWQFTSGHIPFYYDHFNAMNITDNVMLDNGNDFSVNICDFLCEMMSKDKSLSGVVNENVREIAALSTTYVICERLGIDKNETHLDLSAITSLSDEEVNLTATITAIYARSMLKAAQRTVSSVTKEQIEERSRNVMFTAEELSEFEDITDAVYDEEISEETTVETAEDEEKKYTVPETLENVTADNNNDDIIQQNKSVVTVQPVSEVSDSGLTAEKQQEILETALMIDNGSLNKERINALFSGNISVNALTSYVRTNYKGKSYNSTNDDIISAYLARNDCFVVRYNIDDNAGNLSYDWQTVTNTIDKLIREDRFITPKEKDDTAEEKTSLTLHKVGDFWEMYDNDARVASEALGLYLSRKGKVAMCGFPDKEKDNYTQRLRDAGFIIINDNIPENKKDVLPDSITIKFGTENDPELTTESKLLDDLITKYRNEHNGNDMSFALANAVIEYLDEKQHLERADKDNKVGWYKKTWFTVTATISGEQFSYEARYDIGDGKGTGGGSIIDHIEQFQTEIIRQKPYPYNTEESQNTAKNAVDILIPYLKANTELTEEEKLILWELKRDNPIKGIQPVLDPKLLTHYIPSGLPLIADNNDVFFVLRHDRFYHHNRQEIADFFETHANAKEREQFIRKAINEEYSQLSTDEDKTMGYKTFEDGLCIWEGNYMSHTAENFYSWEDVVTLFADMMQRGEYLDTQIIDTPETVEDNVQEDAAAQLSFFGEPETMAATTKPKSRKDTSEIDTRPMFNVTDDMVNYVLRCGSATKGTLERIIAQYQKGKSDAENGEFLSREFNSSFRSEGNGRGYVYSESELISSWWDRERLWVGAGESALNAKMYNVAPWNLIAARVGELIEKGQFCSQAVIDRAAEMEIKDIADQLWYLHQDTAEEIYQYFIPDEMFKGGFPDSAERIKNDLMDSDKLQDYISGMTKFVNDYEQNRDILRFHFHRPRETLERLKDLTIERRQFKADPDFEFIPSFFISEDEKNRVIQHFNYQTKFKIRDYFDDEERTTKDKVKFLNNLYSDGGFGDRNTNFYYGKKGYTIVHSPAYDEWQGCTATMNWKNVVVRIDSLIKIDKFISEEDKKEQEKLIQQKLFEAKNKEELEKAKENIRNFWESEYGGGSDDFTDLHKVGIAYTTVDLDENYFLELQVYADLMDHTLRYYVDNELYKEEKYDDLHSFNEDVLSVLDFQELYEQFNVSELEEKHNASIREIEQMSAEISADTSDNELTVMQYGAAQRNLKAFNELFPEFMQKEYAYMRMEAGDAYEPLSLEWLSEDTFSIMHFYDQNGDLMYDPDVVIKVDATSAQAISFENSSLGIYESYTSGLFDQDDCNNFVEKWLANISHQGYKPVRIKNYDDEIVLDTTYSELMHENEATPNIDSDIIGIDKLKRNGSVVYWNYFNEDGNDGNGQFIEMTITEFDINEAVKVMSAAGGRTKLGYQTFINYIEDHSSQTIIDKGTEDFENVKAEFLNGEYDIQVTADNDSREQLIADFIDNTDHTRTLVPDNIGYAIGIYSGEAFDKTTIDENTKKYKVVAQIDRKNRIAVKWDEPDLPERVKDAISKVALTYDIVEDDTQKAEDAALDFLGLDEVDDEYIVLRNKNDAVQNDAVQLSIFGTPVFTEENTPVVPVKVGAEIEYQDRTYTVTAIKPEHNEIDLLDQHTGWYPITRVEPLDVFISEYDAEAAKSVVEAAAVVNGPQNYTITDDELGVGTPKEKYKANIAAIKLLKQIEAEDRQATVEEQDVLAHYVGWGGLSGAFEQNNSSWENEYTELKNLLTPEEYNAALNSTVNAHFTSPVIIKKMYSALENFGFKGGKVLEPSCGIGNFLGCVPSDKAANYQFTGVEIDSITGRIAKQLYPQAKIQVTGFQNADVKDNYFDVVIGNVPFANYSVTDRKYNKSNHLIHDYFILKSLDLTRAGGVVAVITSSGTMDKVSAKVRTEISNKAKLIGAIRLPDTAFEKNAGTNAVADILFLQKRSEPNADYEDWLEVDRETYYGLPINQYFIDHPEMVCGTVLETSGRYGNTLTVRENEGETLEQALDKAIQNLQATISVQTISRPQPTITEENKDAEWLSIREQYEADPDMRNHTFRMYKSRPFFKEGSVLAEVDIRDFSEQEKDMLTSLIKLIDQYKETLYTQKHRSDEEFIEAQKGLNNLYDSYTAKYGPVRDVFTTRKKAKIRKVIENSDDFYNLHALETEDKDDSTKLVKAAIFNRRTVSRAIEITHCDTTVDAYSVCLNTKARIDLEYISSLVDKPIEDCIKDLNGTYIFRDPEKVMESDITSGWETADEYLSGNVARKLRIAEGYSAVSPDYAINVEMLKKVQPERIPVGRISAQLGSSWIPEKYIEQFIREKLDVDTTVEHDLASSTWHVNNTNMGDWRELCCSVYGTKDMNALKLVDASLNLRNAKVGHVEDGADGKKHYVVDQEKTQEAMNKQDTVKEMFENWIFADPYRAQELEDIFNARFNVYRLRTFDGSHLTFDGMNSDIALKDYQKDAVARMLYGGSSILSHVVGAGKTFEMTAAAMELRRTGLATKPLFVVPNHLVNQWAADFTKLYPEANVLAINGGDKAKRQKMTSRIATGDWDAVIMPYSVFAKVQLSPNRRALYYQQEIDQCIAIEEEQRGSISAKAAVTRRKQLENRLDALDYIMDRDKNIYFEETGIDYIFVDEAHNFKNLYTNTKLNNIKGITSTGSKMAENLLLVTNYLREVNGENRGTVLASGTIISNSMTELYTAMRYVAPSYLKEKGYSSFDSWIADYGRLTTDLELDPTGTSFRSITKFKEYKNVTLLQTDFHTCADVKMKEDLDLKTPKVKTLVVVTEPTEIQKAFIKECGERADRVHNKEVGRDVDNMLLISTDGSKCALDQRLIDPSYPDDPNSKINICVENVFKVYTDTNENRLTQVIFLDTSTPKGDGIFSLYDDIKKKLIAKGIPEEEIAYVHDAKNAEEKEKLFEKVRNRDIRVILGSTEKMGAGTNIQDYLYAIHHLDIPWRPSDYDQRNGRGERQGNKCADIGDGQILEFKYSCKGTFDAYRWQTIEGKSIMIKQVLTSKLHSDEIEAFDDTSLKYAEIKALSLGDPRIKEFATLKNDIQKLKQKKSQFDTELHDAQRKAKITYPQEIKALNNRLLGLYDDKKQAAATAENESFTCTIRGNEFTDKKEAGKTLIGLKKIATQEGIAVGEYRGFKMLLVETGITSDYSTPIISLELRRRTTFRTSMGTSHEGVFDNIDNILDNMIDKSIAENEDKLKETEKNLNVAKTRCGDVFPHEDELREKQHRYKELSLELAVGDDSDNRMAAISADETENNTTSRGRR
ncbi:DUF6908 domain-containing protein [Ruminococcus albus]|uniref:Adenine-specific DNA methylase, N12 class n=1 Tax=Ruminococcus albus TaxID=1264 RepID=A0A1I1R588_RUMAL|nr:SNF2-related protein [Ruminococcus albus]SFD26723.1 Adenine-specific DNA methylase, N12 class [Ruminococcus albus]